MKISFEARANPTWYRGAYTNKASRKWDVVQLEDGEAAATCTSFATKAEAADCARLMQIDEDAGLTVGGVRA